MKTKLTWFDRIMTAVAFAEANESATAKKILNTTAYRQKKERKYKECDAVLSTELNGVEAHS
jgi:hypothetical protein